MWPQRVCTMPTFGIAEVGDEARRKSRLREEVGVEDRDELALRDLEARVERAGLVADAVDAVEVDDVDALVARSRSTCARDERACVSSVESSSTWISSVARVVHAADRIEQPRRDRRLVEERQLDRDERQLAGRVDYGHAACFARALRRWRQQR